MNNRVACYGPSGHEVSDTRYQLNQQPQKNDSLNQGPPLRSLRVLLAAHNGELITNTRVIFQ